jgi:hypothetical protein
LRGNVVHASRKKFTLHEVNFDELWGLNIFIYYTSRGWHILYIHDINNFKQDAMISAHVKKNGAKNWADLAAKMDRGDNSLRFRWCVSATQLLNS